jgi:hypothetical protein
MLSPVPDGVRIGVDFAFEALATAKHEAVVTGERTAVTLSSSTSLL